MKYCVANWKMNMTSKDALCYLGRIGELVKKEGGLKNELDNISMIICPPYTSLDLTSSIIKESIDGVHEGSCFENISKIYLGVQNINPNKEGAHTGEVSINMIQEYGVNYAIIGHSERRSQFSESNELINLKIKSLLEREIHPILCIGETLEERERGKTKEVLYNQLKHCLDNIACVSQDFLIAYEPIWAIGTGKTADNDIIESANSMILNIIKELKYGIKNPKILYGGSVNNNNAKSLSKICNLDGFLIGGASLDAEEFYRIYNTLKGE